MFIRFFSLASIALLFAGPSAASDTTPLMTERLLAQEGLAIAGAANVLNTQTAMALLIGGFTIDGCNKLQGGGSAKVAAPLKNGKGLILDWYYDAKCQSLFISDALTGLYRTKADTRITVTASYYREGGAKLGVMKLDETTYWDKNGDPTGVHGIGIFAPTSGLPAVQLGLDCIVDDLSDYPCQVGVAQTFKDAAADLGSVTPLTYKFGAT